MSKMLNNINKKAKVVKRIDDYIPYLSPVSLRRQASPIRALQPLMRAPGMISLGGGLPNSKCFPFESISFQLSNSNAIYKIDIQEALQYGPTSGLPSLLKFLQDFIAEEHCLPPVAKEGSTMCITNGSQDGLTKAFEMLLQPNDTLIIEAPTYSGSLAFLEPYGVKFCEVPVDGDGMSTTLLRDKLRNWDHSKKKFPKVIYTIPTGSNPSGASLSNQRRDELYEIAQEYDLLIIEDDPYYYLQFQLEGEGRLHSLLSRDSDGRVLRFDSFSKTLSSGARIGTAYGPKKLIERLEYHMQSTMLHTCNISQSILSTLFSEWGKEGLRNHMKVVSQFYYRQMLEFNKTLLKYELEKKASWNLPTAGMFMWIDLAKNGITDTQDLIKNKAVEKKVLLLPGSIFYPRNESNELRPSSFVRASYSSTTPEQMDLAIERFSQLLK